MKRVLAIPGAVALLVLFAVPTFAQDECTDPERLRRHALPVRSDRGQLGGRC